MDCEICSAFTISNRYGAQACAACGIFFRRQLLNPRPLICRNLKNKCDDDKVLILNCSSCRLRRCFKIGMKGDKIEKPKDSEFDLSSVEHVIFAQVLESLIQVCKEDFHGSVKYLIENDEKVLLEAALKFSKNHKLTDLDKRTKLWIKILYAHNVTQKMNHRNFKNSFSTGIVLIVLFVWVFVSNQPNYLKSSVLQQETTTEKKVIQIFRKCTKEGFETSTTAFTYFENFDNCIRLLPFVKFDFLRASYFEEDKVFLPMKPDFDQEKCIWLTVGIGADDKAEKKFKSEHPNCKFFGIEASPDQYADYANFGKVIPYGVGMEAGTLSLKLRENTKYVNKNVTVVPFIDLLDTYIGQRFIYYMTIDIEGVELSILKELLPGGKLDEQGVAFCQIDAELHRFRTESQDYIKDFLNQFNAPDSNYLPIYHAMYLKKHHKVTFINIEKKECQKAFDLTSYLK